MMAFKSVLFRATASEKEKQRVRAHRLGQESTVKRTSEEVDPLKDLVDLLAAPEWEQATVLELMLLDEGIDDHLDT